MKNIAVITIHWANNYGGTLQAFALVEVLKKYANVTVLDYRAVKPEKGMKLIRYGFKPIDILRAGKDVFRIFPRSRVIRKFKNFTYKYIPLSDRLINEEDFVKLRDDYDVFISGSDQIWSPSITGENSELDTRFLLDFVISKPKVSYASSIGSFLFSKHQEELLEKHLSDFKALSVREADTAEFLSGLLERQVSLVVDPTLLLSESDWVNKFDLNTKKNNKPYILVFALMKDRNLKRTISYFRKKLNMSVIAIDQDPFLNYKPNVHVMDAGPIEFLDLFYNADFIITNSFHGTCFSVIFNKKFVVTIPPTGINRIKSLLGQIGLENKYLSETDDPGKFDQSIDYSYVNENLKKIRYSSMEYLNFAIQK